MRGMFEQTAPPAKAGPTITVPAMLPILSRTPGVTHAIIRAIRLSPCCHAATARDCTAGLAFMPEATAPLWRDILYSISIGCGCPKHAVHIVLPLITATCLVTLPFLFTDTLTSRQSRLDVCRCNQMGRA